MISQDLGTLRPCIRLPADLDMAGEITVAELGNVMRSLHLTPSETELQDIMNEIDVDSSGSISFDGKHLISSPK